jgi:hypothetical protein
MKIEFSGQIFEKCCNVKFNETRSSGSRQTDGRTDLTNCSFWTYSQTDGRTDISSCSFWTYRQTDGRTDLTSCSFWTYRQTDGRTNITSCSFWTYRQTDGRTDITKVTVAFRNFANAPKTTRKSYIITSASV